MERKNVPEEALISYLEKDIDKDRFLNQLAMLTDMIKTAFSSTEIKRVTTLKTIAEAMNECEIYKKMLGEVHKALKYFPVTTSTAERSFSSLRRLNLSMQYNDPITTKQRKKRLNCESCRSEL